MIHINSSFTAPRRQLRSDRPTMTLRSGRKIMHPHPTKKPLLPITKCPIPVVDLLEAQPLTAGSRKVTNLYVIRHGQSLFNVPDSKGIKYISGESNHVPLTEQGKKEARTLGEKLSQKIAKGQEIVICSSTAVRAKQTADILFETLSAHFQCTRTEHDCFVEICEGKNGEWEGKPRDASWKKENEKYEARSAIDKYTNPELSTGESQEDGGKRALPAFQRIFSSYPGKLIFVVSHGRIMRTISLVLNKLIPRLSSEPHSALPTPDVENCDLLHLKKPIGKPIEAARVVQQFSTKIIDNE